MTTFLLASILCIVMMMKERRGRTTSQKWVGETWTWNITFKLIALLCYLFLEKDRKSPYLRKKKKIQKQYLEADCIFCSFIFFDSCLLSEKLFCIVKMNHCLFNIFKLFSKKFFLKFFRGIFLSFDTWLFFPKLFPYINELSCILNNCTLHFCQHQFCFHVSNKHVHHY